jgi:putative DNA primase/helicase
MTAPRHASDYALEYARRGWNVVPVRFKGKKPIGEGWQTRVIREADVPKHFNGARLNVGVEMGASSDGLTDGDLDSREAVAIAPYVLPRTGAVFGRTSNRSSHWLYISNLHEGAYGAAIQFRDPLLKGDEAMLFELRIGGRNESGEIKGAQTVFPGSVHESGEAIVWEKNGEPATVDGDELLRLARRLGACCLLARYYPGEGARHDTALTLGGFLARAGLKPPEIKCLVEAITRAAGDDEWRDRIRAAEDAAIEYIKNRPTRGFPALKKTFGDVIAKQVAEWLDYQEQADEPAGDEVPSRGHSNDIVTEDSAAVQFVEQHGENLRYCHSTGSWFRWNGILWVRDQTGLAFHWARELARKTAEDQNARKRYIIQRRAFASGVEAFAKVDPQIAVTANHWDRDPWLLGTPAGTVDLRSGELRKSDRRDGITRVTLVAPSADGCPLWLQFLKETTGNDEDLIRFLRQWCGYCLTGVTNEHALLFVYGDGGNGKSVFINVKTSILKDYAATSAMETFTASNSDKHPTELAMLRGARLVTASETEAGKAWAEARIKLMTGGDPITARFMRQDFFTYMPQFKLTIIGNHKPTLHNVDEAARRRFNIVPFTRKPATPDPLLGEKLMTEAPGILQWMIEGSLDWQKNGLVRPACVIEATEEYFSDQEVFPRWLEEECITHRGPGATIAAASSELYRSWIEYARSVEAKPGTQADFKESMRRAGFTYRKRNTKREFVGVRLKPKQEAEAEWATRF